VSKLFTHHHASSKNLQRFCCVDESCLTGILQISDLETWAIQQHQQHYPNSTTAGPEVFCISCRKKLTKKKDEGSMHFVKAGTKVTNHPSSAFRLRDSQYEGIVKLWNAIVPFRCHAPLGSIGMNMKKKY
jgi:hypothetical protein